MKKITLLAILLISTSAFGQTKPKTTPKVIRDSTGNFISVSAPTAKKADSTTVYKYTNSKGVTWPVYKSAKGRYYCWKVSKNTGKGYRYYLPEK